MPTTNKEKPVFRKVISEETLGGDIKKQITVDLSKWAFDEDESTGQKASSGYTCQIKVLKLGNKPKNSYINFNPFNKDIREAIGLMYKEADRLEKK